MYPSPNLSLLQILYSDSTFYNELLANEIVSNIVNELWIFKYYFTYNIFTTSTAYNNLLGSLLLDDNLKNYLSSSTNKISYYLSINTNDFDHSHLSLGEIDIIRLKKIQRMDFLNPFYFLNKSNLISYKFSNHIFSFDFGQNPQLIRFFSKL